ncbi:Fc.00g053110.m01.CDS01 [Cosmosporella sp. VM-42]
MAAPIDMEGAIPTGYPDAVPLEVAVFSPEDALMAIAHGAKRIELNANGSYNQGGLTPDVEAFKSLVTDPRYDIDVPIRIMIRPKVIVDAPDFMYKWLDVCHMHDAITAFKATGLMNLARGDGFVFGILDLDGRGSEGERRFKINSGRCKILIDRARPFPCVFHRAFDPIAATGDWKLNLEAIADVGFTGILTSGGHGNYLDNLDRIGEICDYVARRIQIIIGGGVRAKHVMKAIQDLVVEERLSFQKNGNRTLKDNIWMHSACLKPNPDFDSTDLLNRVELLNLVSELGLIICD